MFALPYSLSGPWGFFLRNAALVCTFAFLLLAVPSRSAAQSDPIFVAEETSREFSVPDVIVRVSDPPPTLVVPRLNPLDFRLKDSGGNSSSDYDSTRAPLFTDFPADAILKNEPPRERFHLKEALVQSLEFLVFEHAFRLATDPYARHLLFHKPFWSDYLASANSFDMSRWGDGDNFLVNYIGHPLEGSVAGNIFIQNDPTGRSLKFGKSGAYWRSRFKAMAWAAAYSAYFEIGPILSEAALGNEGGYTYIPNCGFYPTCDKEPGREYKPPTNNTGWVDFVVTPTIGMGWIVLEDAIEAQFVDRLAQGRHEAKFNLLRAGLSPSRSMSNLLAFKRPWYRPSDDEAPAALFGSFFRPSTPTPLWKFEPRWDLTVGFTTANMLLDWEGCASCRSLESGVALNLSYRIARFIYLDNEFDVFPGSGSKGGVQQGLAGLKFGSRIRNWGLFSQLRPGFVHYNKSLVPGSSTNYESATRFAVDLGGTVEYYTSSRSAIRLNFGTTLVHYKTGYPDPEQPPVSVLSTDNYITQGNIHLTGGYIFRF